MDILENYKALFLQFIMSQKPVSSFPISSSELPLTMSCLQLTIISVSHHCYLYSHHTFTYRKFTCTHTHTLQKRFQCRRLCWRFEWWDGKKRRDTNVHTTYIHLNRTFKGNNYNYSFPPIRFFISRFVLYGPQFHIISVFTSPDNALPLITTVSSFLRS